MVGNTKIEEIGNGIKELEKKLNELILYNPNFGFINKDSNEKKVKGIIWGIITSFLVAIFIGMGISSFTFAHSDDLPIHFLLTQGFIMIVGPFFLYLIGGQTTNARNGIIVAIMYLIIAVLAWQASKDKDLFNKILPYVNLGVVSIIYSYVFFSLYRTKKLKNSIFEDIKQLTDIIKKVQEDRVLTSHSIIEKKINEFQSKIDKNATLPCGNFLNTQTSSIWDILKLELIIHSRNGINLIENWEHIDLAQNMIDKIMEDTPNSKHITIDGDLGFLSTKDGLDMLVTAIIQSKKTFDIYFTGKKKEGQKHNNLDVIESDECKALVSNFKQNYSDHKDYAMIKKHTNFVPMVSDAFTGIGFIGLANESKQYNKIYAYISNLIIKSGDTNIVYANPFVFSWNAKDDYFKNFVTKLVANAAVLIDDEYIEGKDLLNIKRKKK